MAKLQAVTVPLRILTLLLSLLVTGTLSVSAHALARSETRVGGPPFVSPVFVAPSASQVAESHQENSPGAYDFASGVHKYLYCHDDPVNRIDPSGLADFLLFWGDEQGVPFEDAAKERQNQILARSDFNSAVDRTYVISVRKFSDVAEAFKQHKEVKEVYFFVHHSPDVMHLDMVSTASDSNVSKSGGTYVRRTGWFRRESYLTTSFRGWDNSGCTAGGRLFIYGCHSDSFASDLGLYLFGRKGEGVGTTCYFPRDDTGRVTPMNTFDYYFFLPIGKGSSGGFTIGVPIGYY